jgi:hypothetical protein
MSVVSPFSLPFFYMEENHFFPGVSCKSTSKVYYSWCGCPQKVVGDPSFCKIYIALHVEKRIFSLIVHKHKKFLWIFFHCNYENFYSNHNWIFLSFEKPIHQHLGFWTLMIHFWMLVLNSNPRNSFLFLFLWYEHLVILHRRGDSTQKNCLLCTKFHEKKSYSKG